MKQILTGVAFGIIIGYLLGFFVGRFGYGLTCPKNVLCIKPITNNATWDGGNGVLGKALYR